ncbi:MAG: ABC transporter ATP-binding protein [Holophagales bacterium]|nr:ABC transporter ATP-binding protein [Holophagales bacterium]
MASPKIRIRNLRKRFGEKIVLSGVDLEIPEGESLVILGGSGSGKSVLLKHVVGLLRPDEGSVEVGGVDLAGLSPRALIEIRRRFGMSFQEGALFDSMSVSQNIAFPLTRARPRPSRREIEARVRECLDLVGLEGTGKKMPSELSGGMRRRVGFARAIALEPEILLFDEPTTGLDPVMTAVIDDVIRNLQSQLGSTAITITHDLTSAFRIADRVAMLHGGRIRAIADPEVFRQLDDPYVRQFLEGRSEGPLTAD